MDSTLPLLAGSTGLWGILGILISVLLVHWLTRQRERNSSRNASVSKWIQIVTDEIARINGEKPRHQPIVGDISIIESLIMHIRTVRPDIALDAQWEKYKENEHRRNWQQPEKRAAALESLREMLRN